MPAHKKLSNKKSKKELSVDFDYQVNGDPLGNEELISPHNNGRPAFEFSLEEKIANLTALNGTLIREISSLRLEKENLTCILNEFGKKRQEDALTGDSLFYEDPNNKTNAEGLSGKVSAFKDAEVFTDENTALSRERTALLQDKERLEGAVSEAMQNLAVSQKRAELSESSVAIAKARINVLEAEIEKVLSCNQALNKERADLKTLVDERDKELKELQLRMLSMEDERQSLQREVEKSVEKASSTKEIMGGLHSQITRLEEQQITRQRELEEESVTLKERQKQEYMNLVTNLKQEKVDLETALSQIELDFLEMERQRMHATEMLRHSEAEIASLQKEINLSKSLQGNTVLELEKEQDSRNDLLKEISMAVSSRKMLEESLSSALASLDKFQENTEQMGRQIVILEDHNTLLSKQINELQVSKQDHELELQNQIAELTDEVNNKQAENSILNQKLSSLEMVLCEMEAKSKCENKRLWELVSELKSFQNLLHKKEHVVKYAVPIAAISSGTLAFVSLLAFLKFRKKH